MSKPAYVKYGDNFIYARSTNHCRYVPRLGLRNFVGVMLCATLFTVLLAAGAGECGRHVVDVDTSRRATQGERLLNEILEAVTAYPYDKIAQLSSPRQLEECDVVDAGFSVDLGVTPVKRGMVRIKARVVDSWQQKEVGQFVTYRTQG